MARVRIIPWIPAVGAILSSVGCAALLYERNWTAAMWAGIAFLWAFTCAVNHVHLRFLQAELEAASERRQQREQSASMRSER